MEITLFRHPGYYGRAMPLDIFANEQKVASIQSGATQRILLADGEVALRVGMKGILSSPAVSISPCRNGQHFECGTPFWLLFDFMSLCYLPCLKGHAFFLREVLLRDEPS